MNNHAIMFRSFSDLKEWQAFSVETYILEKLYYPMWYHFNACLTVEGDIALWKTEEYEIQCYHNSKDIGTMIQMLCGFKADNEYWELSITCESPESNYHIGVSCPNQAQSYGGIMAAMVNDKTAYSYSKLKKVVEELLEIIQTDIFELENEPQWIKL